MLFSYYSLFHHWVINLFLIKYIIIKLYSQKSFNAIDSWLKELKSNSNPDVKIFLVGNKIDLEEDRVVSTEEAEDLVNDLEFDYFLETSAKTGFNAKNVFIQAAKLLYTEHLKYKDRASRPGSLAEVLPVEPKNQKLDNDNNSIFNKIKLKRLFKSH